MSVSLKHLLTVGVVVVCLLASFITTGCAGTHVRIIDIEVKHHYHDKVITKPDGSEKTIKVLCKIVDGCSKKGPGRRGRVARDGY
jgi:hypothetical protein|tara:strand:+ start:578 stop:832 length:255 start_codon:yes stop_codon:yes gene_type:complete